MQFRHKPMTQDEREQRGKYYKEGMVDFTVLDIAEGISKAGNPMVIIELVLWDEDHKEGKIKEYITEAMNWKTEDFLSSIGYAEDANNENINFYNYIGKSGKGRIKYKKDDLGKWQLQFNYIVAFDSISKKSENEVPFIDDDIKF